MANKKFKEEWIGIKDRIKTFIPQPDLTFLCTYFYFSYIKPGSYKELEILLRLCVHISKRLAIHYLSLPSPPNQQTMRLCQKTMELQSGGMPGTERVWAAGRATHRRVLAGAFPLYSPVYRGALENEVAVKCFNGH